MVKVLILILLCGMNLWAGWFTAESNIAPFINKIVEANVNQNYDVAENESVLLEQKYTNSPAGCFFHSITLLAKYDDLGNITLVDKTEKKLNQCIEKLDQMSLSDDEKNFWKGLMFFQLGYALSIQGSTLKSTTTMRSGAKIMENLKDNLDATAFYSIYGYYIDQITSGISWLPFVEDNRKSFIKNLETAVFNSLYFSTLFRSTLCWMNYDEKNFQKSLDLVNGFLVKHPKHRVYNQMQGDMYFRLEKYTQAALVYENNLKEYFLKAPYSVRYYSAVANLSRIYQELNDSKKSYKYSQMLTENQFLKIESQMPNSLLKDLKKRNLYAK